MKLFLVSPRGFFLQPFLSLFFPPPKKFLGQSRASKRPCSSRDSGRLQLWALRSDIESLLLSLTVDNTFCVCKSFGEKTERRFFRVTTGKRLHFLFFMASPSSLDNHVESLRRRVDNSSLASRSLRPSFCPPGNDPSRLDGEGPPAQKGHGEGLAGPLLPRRRRRRPRRRELPRRRRGRRGEQ